MGKKILLLCETCAQELVSELNLVKIENKKNELRVPEMKVCDMCRKKRYVDRYR